MEPFVIPLDEIEEGQLSLVGGKALNLARLRRAGFKVPHGFVLTTALYREASGDGDALKVPPHVQDRICECYRRLSQRLVAVRSSASHEDSATASFAGQGRTILNVSGEPSLLEAIIAVWRSLESSHAREYARHRRIEADNLAMAVVVQELVDAEVSGVMFTINPVTGDRREMIINATWGLGEPLVSGKVNPDEVVIDTATRTVKRTTVGRKDLALNATGGQATDRRPADALCLNDELVGELIESGDRLAEHFDGPQDIEWAWSDTLYILQTRPLTTAANTGCGTVSRPCHSPDRRSPNKSGESDGPCVESSARLRARAGDLRSGHVRGQETRAQQGQDAYPTSDEAETLRQQQLRRLESVPHVRRTIWVAKGMAEVLPCPTPLSWEVASRFMSGEEGYGLGQRYLGFDPAPGTILQRIAGHVYVDLDRESDLFFRHAPIGPCVREVQENPLRAAMPRQVFDWRKLRPGLLVRWPQLAVQVVTLLQKLRRQRRDFLPFFQECFRREFEQYMQAELGRDYASLSEPALADLFQQRLDHFLTKTSPILTAGSILAAMSYRELEDLLIERLGAEGVELAQQLTTGLKPNPTLDMLDGMSAVANGDKSEDEFVREFGHRCSNEFELAVPRWREDRDTLRSQIEQLRDTRQSHDSRSQATSACQAAKSKLECIQRQWGRIGRELVRSRLDIVRRLFPLREQTKDLLMREYELLRAPLVELERRLDLSGGAFYLNSEEIHDCARGQDFSDLISQRRDQHTLAQQLTLPQVILGSELGEKGVGSRLPERPEGCFAQTTPDPFFTGDLRGLGVSSGIARGRVRIVRSADDLSAVKPDEILITESLDPTWTLGYTQAAALVAERGATLSHGAIIAREFGIPAVVNVAGCVSRLLTGQSVEVDGSKGSVTLIG